MTPADFALLIVALAGLMNALTLCWVLTRVDRLERRMARHGGPTGQEIGKRLMEITHWEVR